MPPYNPMSYSLQQALKQQEENNRRAMAQQEMENKLGELMARETHAKKLGIIPKTIRVTSAGPGAILMKTSDDDSEWQITGEFEVEKKCDFEYCEV